MVSVGHRVGDMCCHEGGDKRHEGTAHHRGCSHRMGSSPVFHEADLVTNPGSNERPIRCAAKAHMEGRTLSQKEATAAGKLQLKAELYVDNNRSVAAFQSRRHDRKSVVARHRREATKELKSTVGFLVWFFSPFISALIRSLVEAILKELFGDEQ